MNDSGDDVAGDEEIDESARREERVGAAVGDALDEDAEDGVDCGGEEDGGDDNEEVLDYEEVDSIGVDFYSDLQLSFY